MIDSDFRLRLYLIEGGMEAASLREKEKGQLS